MASNFVNWQNYYQVPTGTTAVTFGTAQPNVITPAALVEVIQSTALTINLPNIADVLAAPTATTQLTQGVASDFTMTIFNTGGATITIVPYSVTGYADTTLPATITIGTVAGTSTVTLKCEAATQIWYQVAKV